jgi:hypothetical protein
MSKHVVYLVFVAVAGTVASGCGVQVTTTAEKSLFPDPVGFTTPSPGEPGMLVRTTDLTTNEDAGAIASIRALDVWFLGDNRGAAQVVLDAWFARDAGIASRDLFAATSLPVDEWQPVLADEARGLYHAWQSQVTPHTSEQFAVPWREIENHAAVQRTFNPNVDRDATNHKLVTVYLVCRPTGDDVFISDLRIRLEVDAWLLAGGGIKSPSDGDIVLRLL